MKEFQSDNAYGTLDYYADYFKYRLPDISDLEAFKLAIEYMKVKALRALRT